MTLPNGWCCGNSSCPALLALAQEEAFSRWCKAMMHMCHNEWLVVMVVVCAHYNLLQTCTRVLLVLDKVVALILRPASMVLCCLTVDTCVFGVTYVFMPT
jgi:hypothetical protein